VNSPQRLSANIAQAKKVLDLVPYFHIGTWGADEQHTDDMWNSNSLTSCCSLAVATTCASSNLPRVDAHPAALPGW